ncbi:cilia- and flagella-associated protein 119 isoform 1 [Danio rerio]|uniref:Coiled-coil domain-containing protein 189 isoform 1 n=2 Tax=Danio rerio TaxID=7955 RepID=U3JAD7_DANRE|nr:coiled-coil domain-containing protein 189 isoform 1 [Danio rerio]|eukprot:NP_001314955.1 coiled-coil domain-containing protein 189 isoform 1 [Danio rerio]
MLSRFQRQGREMKPFDKIMVPQVPKARVLLWADLKHSDMEEIEKSKSTQDIERILCRALVADESQPKQRVLLELYTNLVRFCREQNFNREQTSVLISIIKNVHQFNTETSLNNTDDCLTYCSELLICHSVRRPPFSIDLFNSEQVTHILYYFINTYMRHYFLYKYIFTPEVQLDISLSYTGIPEDTDIEPTAKSQSESPADEERETERETEMDGEVQQSSELPEMKTTEIKSPNPGLSSKSDLRTIVEKEVRNEVMRLSAQLQQELKNSADQLNNAISQLETNIQVKK